MISATCLLYYGLRNTMMILIAELWLSNNAMAISNFSSCTMIPDIPDCNADMSKTRKMSSSRTLFAAVQELWAQNHHSSISETYKLPQSWLNNLIAREGTLQQSLILLQMKSKSFLWIQYWASELCAVEQELRCLFEKIKCWDDCRRALTTAKWVCRQQAKPLRYMLANLYIQVEKLAFTVSSVMLSFCC